MLLTIHSLRAIEHFAPYASIRTLERCIQGVSDGMADASPEARRRARVVVAKLERQIRRQRARLAETDAGQRSAGLQEY